MGPLDLQAELDRLINEYNKYRGTYLFIYYSAIEKPIPDTQLMMSDYYIIHDFLNGRNLDKIDIFLQTPGGSGETVEEIVRFLHKNRTMSRLLLQARQKVLAQSWHFQAMKF